MEVPNLLLFGRYLQSREALEQELSVLKDEFTNINIFGRDPISFTGQLDIVPQGVILDLAHWTPNDEVIVTNLRAAGYSGPVLVLSHRDEKQPLPTSRLFDKVVFLEKPYDSEEMIGIVRRMLLAPIIAARKFPRHATDENAELQVDGRTTAFACRVKNMSKGGAYLDFDRPIHVRVGDLVVLKISLGQVKRVYALRARVAWINTKSPGFGIEFVVALGAE